MFHKLDFIQEKYADLSMKVSDPEIINNQSEWQKYVRELADIEPIVNQYKEYKGVKEGIEEAKSILEESNDEELREMAKMELSDLEGKIGDIEEQLKLLLVPKDPNDEKNVIVEIRAGAGGDEAGLFAGDLLRMYTRYAERNRWKVEMMSMMKQVLEASRK
jgi:peptide chain release factor 1